MGRLARYGAGLSVLVVMAGCGAVPRGVVQVPDASAEFDRMEKRENCRASVRPGALASLDEPLHDEAGPFACL